MSSSPRSAHPQTRLRALRARGGAHPPFALTLALCLIPLGGGFAALAPAGMGPPFRLLAQSDATPEGLTEESFRQLLESPRQQDWIEALVEARALLESPSPPGWVQTVLLEFLTDSAFQTSPARAETILGHRIIQGRLFGQKVLLALLERDLAPELRSQVISALERNSADRERRRLLLEFLKIADAKMFPRIFPICAYHEPRPAVAVGIEVLQGTLALEPESPTPGGDGRPDVVAALNEFLGLELADARGWVDWWAVNQNAPLLKGRLDRERQVREQEAVRQFKQVIPLLQSDPGKERDYLLLNLKDDVPARVREMALREMRQLALSLSLNGGTRPLAQRRELLQPAADRLVELVEDPNEPVMLKRLALTALGEMKILREYPRIVQLLAALLAEEPMDAEGMLAVQIAGSLQADLGPDLDGVLARLLPGEEQLGDPEAWKRVSAERVTTVLRSLRSIGLREATIDLLSVLTENLPPLRNQVVVTLQAASDSIPQGLKPQVLAMFREILEDPAPDAQRERLAAILGVGDLGLPEGIAILSAFITSANSGEQRSSAVRAIGNVGGTPAVRELRELLAAVSEEPIRAEIVGIARDLVSADPSLLLLEVFVLSDPEKEDSRVPWFESFVAEPGVARLLDPSENAARILEGGDQGDDVLLRWGRLRKHVCEIILEKARSAPALKAQQLEYQRLADSAGEVLGFVPKEKLESPFFPKKTFEEFLSIGERRAEILGAIARGHSDDLIEALEGRLSSARVEKGEDRAPDLLWALEAISSGSAFPNEKILLERVEALANAQSCLTPEVQQAIARLATRSETPPAPPPDDGEQGDSRSEAGAGGR